MIHSRIVSAALCALAVAGCSAPTETTELEPVARHQEALVSNIDPPAAGTSMSTYRRAGWHYNWCDRMGGCDGFEPAASTTPKRTRSTNSQVPFTRDIQLGDFDGDGIVEYVQHDKNRVFASRTLVDKPELAHVFVNTNVDRVIVGDFYGAGWDQLCVTQDSLIRCFGIDPAVDDQFRFWFQVQRPIDDDEDVIVADFDGDRRDEMLLYDRTNGDMRIWAWTPSQEYFFTKDDWAPTNLHMAGSANVKWRAGDYDGDGDADLIAINASKQVMVFASVRDAGLLKFWWAFTSNTNFIKADEEVHLGRVNDDMKDDLVIHNTKTGAVRFHKVSFNGGNPAAIALDAGGLRVSANTRLVVNWAHGASSAPGADKRDDVFVYDADDGKIYKAEAYWDASASKHTFQSPWSHQTPDNDSGWPALRTPKLLFIKCKYLGYPGEFRPNSFYDTLTDRIVDYFGEISYGGWELSGRTLDQTWHQMTLAPAEGQARAAEVDDCIDASGYDEDDYDAVVIYANTLGNAGATGSRALLSPGMQDVRVGVHEIAHAMWGSQHPYRRAAGVDTLYGDPWDPMSAATVGFYFTNELNVQEGPGMTAYTLNRHDNIPTHRIRTLDWNSGTKTIPITALNRPASDDALELRVKTSGAPYYSLEYREQVGYDRNIRVDSVIIHRIENSKSYLLMDDDELTPTKWNTAERRAGEDHTTAEGIKFKIVSLDRAQHLAKVEVSFGN